MTKKDKYKVIKNKQGYANIPLASKTKMEKIAKDPRPGYTYEAVKTPYKNKNGTQLYGIFWRKNKTMTKRRVKNGNKSKRNNK